MALALAIGAACGVVIAVGIFWLQESRQRSDEDQATIMTLGSGASTGAEAPDATPKAPGLPPDGATATLSLRSTPAGLGVVLDGEPLNERTPTRLEVTEGRHTVALQDREVVLWRDSLRLERGRAYSLSPRIERTGRPVVLADAVTRRSGELPRAARNRQILAMLCIDERGKVDTVELRGAPHRDAESIERALSRWRYRPQRIDGERTPVCFALAL